MSACVLLTDKQITELVGDHCAHFECTEDMTKFVMFVLRRATRWPDVDWHRIKQLAEREIKRNAL